MHFGISDKVSRIKYIGILEILIRAKLVIVLPLKFYPEITSKVFVFLGLDNEALEFIQFLNDYFYYFLIFNLFIWLFLKNESKILKLSILIEFLLIGFLFYLFSANNFFLNLFLFFTFNKTFK